MNAFEKWSVWITSALTGLTGVGYFWAKYMVEPADPFSVVNHPLQPWFLKAHIVVSPFLLLAVGTILVRHVWTHYRQGVGKGRRTGIVTAAVLLPMVVTGYLIQAVTHRGWLEALAVSHIVLGVIYLAGLGLHQLMVQLRNGRGPRWSPTEAPDPSGRRRRGRRGRRRSAGGRPEGAATGSRNGS